MFLRPFYASTYLTIDHDGVNKIKKFFKIMILYIYVVAREEGKKEEEIDTDQGCY